MGVDVNVARVLVCDLRFMPTPRRPSTGWGVNSPALEMGGGPDTPMHFSKKRLKGTWGGWGGCPVRVG